jgi:hypothetical protein
MIRISMYVFIYIYIYIYIYGIFSGWNSFMCIYVYLQWVVELCRCMYVSAKRCLFYLGFQYLSVCEQNYLEMAL